MANPTLAITQIKNANVVFKKPDGTIIPAGGPVVWSVSPANAIGFGTPVDNQNAPVTGGTSPGTTVNLTATEPVSGFSATQAVDIKAVQFLISIGTIVLS